MKVIINARVFNGSDCSEGQNIFIENGKITAVSDAPPAPGSEIINAAGNYAVPGFIDLQLYGSGGNLFSAYPSAETLQQMDADLQQKGTTSFLACVATNTPKIVDQSIAAAKAYQPVAKGFLGLHLEGPYLNPKRLGAHIPECVKKAGTEEIKSLLEKAEGVVKMMTIAAELQDDDVISHLLAQNVVLSLGHSDASFEEATAAYNSGITTTTHLFNAMTPIHHRAPGIPTAVMEHPTAMASIIADGNHVRFEVIRFVQQIMKERLFLITDAVTACNIGPYQHRLEGDKFVTADGTLSGSNITMLDAVKNIVQHCGIDLADALKMASAYPAKVIGMENTKGQIRPGFDADILLLDTNLNLKMVFCD